MIIRNNISISRKNIDTEEIDYDTFIDNLSVIDNISYKTTINVLPLTKVKIIKKSTGELNGYPLKDAIYEIYDNNNNVIEEVKTDEDGIAMSNAQFKKGKYYIKEKEAPVGYELDTKAYDFNINGEEEILEIEVYDKPIEREVTIIKKTHSSKLNKLCSNTIYP